MMATLPQQTSPDDSPCLKCTDIVNKDSKALQCDLCRQWVHISCANVGVKAYSTLQSLNGSMWLCESCQEELPMQLKLGTLSEELDSTKSRNDWTVAVQRKRKRNHSSLLPRESLGRFAPVAASAECW